jgi:hypothetical protein
MNTSIKSSMVIRPFSSKRGLFSLLICSLIGFFFAAIVLLIFIIAPGGDAKAHALMMIMGIMSLITVVLGIILYFVFPRVKIIFDTSRKEAITKTGTNAETVVPFSRLEPFQIHEILRGYAHQYFCRNESFGEFTDLFFSSSHGRTLQKAQKLAALTGAALIDYNGNVVA